MPSPRERLAARLREANRKAPGAGQVPDYDAMADAVLAAREGAEPIGCPTPGACSCTNDALATVNAQTRETAVVGRRGKSRDLDIGGQLDAALAEYEAAKSVLAASKARGSEIQRQIAALISQLAEATGAERYL